MGGGGESLINLLVAVVFGGICASIAASKGRSAVGWFFIGLLFSCIGLIIILCLSNLNEEKAKWDANTVEQRRLREQLRQEQLKNEALRQHTTERLDRHDEALGIDTKEAGSPISLTASAPVKLLTEAVPPVVPAGFPDDEWFYEQEGEQIGPCSWSHLYDRGTAGKLTRETLVWATGMPAWMPAKEIPNLIRS